MMDKVLLKAIEHGRPIFEVEDGDLPDWMHRVTGYIAPDALVVNLSNDIVYSVMPGQFVQSWMARAPETEHNAAQASPGDA